MTMLETTKILAVLKAAYPHAYKGMTQGEAEQMLSVWEEMFRFDDYRLVSAAVKSLIASETSSFPPAIGQVKDTMRKITVFDELDENKAWEMVCKAVSRSSYDFQKEFDKLPTEIKKAVGSPQMLREWSQMDSGTFQSVVASNFRKSWRTGSERRRFDALVPPDVKALAASVMKSLPEAANE